MPLPFLSSHSALGNFSNTSESSSCSPPLFIPTGKFYLSLRKLCVYCSRLCTEWDCLSKWIICIVDSSFRPNFVMDKCSPMGITCQNQTNSKIDLSCHVLLSTVDVGRSQYHSMHVRSWRVYCSYLRSFGKGYSEFFVFTPASWIRSTSLSVSSTFA